MSLCRLIYPGFEISHFFEHLILRIIKNQLTRAFADGCQLHQLRRPSDVVWDAVRDGDDEAPPRPLGLSASTEMEEGIIYHLPLVWDNIIKKKVKADRPRRGGGPCHHRPAQRPRQHHWDVLTDEADSHWRKLL